MDSGAEQVTAYSALATAVLFLPSIVLGVAYPVPATNVPASELAAYLTAHRLALLVTGDLGALGFGGVLIVFAGGLWAILREAEGGNGLWSTVALVACVATAVAILVVFTLFGAILYRAPALDPASLPVLMDAALVGNQMTAFPNAVYVVAAGIVILRTGVMPRWVGHGGFLVAVIHLLSATSLAREGAFAPSGVLPNLAPLSHTAWLVCVGVVLLRARRTTGVASRLTA